MENYELIKTQIEDFEKAIISLANNADIEKHFKNFAITINSFIEQNHILKKEYENRIYYDWTIHAEMFDIVNKLKKYSIKFWSKKYQNKDIDYNKFLNDTFSNYKYYIEPTSEKYDFRKYNPRNNVFVPHNFKEFLSVLESHELWCWDNLEEIEFNDNFRLFPIINFAYISDEDMLMGIKANDEDRENINNLNKYKYLTERQPKELKIKDFLFFSDLSHNYQYVKDFSYTNYDDNITINDISICFLSLLQQLKYFIMKQNIDKQNHTFSNNYNSPSLTSAEIELLNNMKNLNWTNIKTQVDIINQIYGCDSRDIKNEKKKQTSICKKYALILPELLKEASPAQKLKWISENIEI